MYFFGKLYFKLKGVEFGKNLKTNGIPLIFKHPDALIRLEDDIVLNSSSKFNSVGINHRVIIVALESKSQILIGSGTGISGAVIHCRSSIEIGRFVGIGANVKIFDHDFHPIHYLERRLGAISENIKTKPVVIEDDCWIGGNVIILKGVTIGRGAIIGAGSVITKDVPPFTIWAGNPAKFVRDIKDQCQQ
jgi:acetyltransferase-like isoleucine patch superfamily enzyme